MKRNGVFLRIGIDARLYDELGVGRYTKNLLANLQKIDKSNQYYIFLLEKDFNRLDFTDNFHKVKANFKWYGFSEQLKFPPLLGKYNLDLVHFPHFNIPILYNGNFVVTIHDLIHQHFSMERVTTHGKLVYKTKQLGYSIAFNTALKKSKKIITVSDYVKEGLKTECNIKEDKIVVTKEAAEDNISKIAAKLSTTQISQILEKFNIKTPFIFYIGNAHPHKNVEGLIKAFSVLRKRYQYLTLVLSGHDHFFWERIKIDHRDKNIIFTGYITDQELAAFYKSAKAYVFPSFEEGFGIPLLEAMSCNCAVISSNKGSLPEVAGDAAVYFDPTNIEDMVDKISQVLDNDKLRKQLIEKGLKRYRLFSWQKLAEQTMEVYKRCE